MRYGAVRYLCPECGHDVFVAFSCKRRGLCPSCDAKRSAMITDAAMERLLPPAQSLYAAKRGPPDEDCQLDPRVDKYDAIDPPAPED